MKSKSALAETILNVTKETQVVTLHEEHEHNIKAAFYAKGKADGTLSAAIHAAMEDDVTRAEIIQWGIECGFSETYVRNAVSAAFVASGKRAHAVKPPRVDERAPALLAQVTASYGNDAAKVLLAAYRLAKRNAEQTAKAA